MQSTIAPPLMTIGLVGVLGMNSYEYVICLNVQWPVESLSTCFSKNSIVGSWFKAGNSLHSTVADGVKLIFTAGFGPNADVLKMCPAVTQCAAFGCSVKQFYVLLVVSRNTNAVKSVAVINCCEHKARQEQYLEIWLCIYVLCYSAQNQIKNTASSFNCRAFHPSRMFLSELLSFGDFSCTDICFRFNKMDLDGTEAQSTKKIHSKNSTAKSLSKDSTTNLIDPEKEAWIYWWKRGLWSWCSALVASSSDEWSR